MPRLALGQRYWGFGGIEAVFSLPVPGYRGGRPPSTTIYIGGREEKKKKQKRTYGNPRRYR
jgi:hypothetical protein